MPITWETAGPGRFYYTCHSVIVGFIDCKKFFVVEGKVSIKSFPSAWCSPTSSWSVRNGWTVLCVLSPTCFRRTAVPRRYGYQRNVHRTVRLTPSKVDKAQCPNVGGKERPDTERERLSFFFFKDNATGALHWRSRWSVISNLCTEIMLLSDVSGINDYYEEMWSAWYFLYLGWWISWPWWITKGSGSGEDAISSCGVSDISDIAIVPSI